MGIGATAADVGFGFGGFGFGPSQDEPSGPSGGRGSTVAGVGVDWGPAFNGQMGIVGSQLDFAPPGTYSAVSPAAFENAMNYGSIVGPTETAVELGQSIAGQANALASNAILNAPQAAVPGVTAAVVGMAQSGMSISEMAQAVSDMGISPTGPFGNFDNPADITGIPAPMSDPQVGPSNVRLGEFAPSGGGDQLAGGGGFDFAAGPDDLSGFGDFTTTAFDTTDQQDQDQRGGGGQFAAAAGAPSDQTFAPDTLDMLTAGGGQFAGGGQQFAALDTGTLTDVGTGGGFTTGGGGFMSSVGDISGGEGDIFGGGFMDAGGIYQGAAPTDVLNDILNYTPAGQEPEDAPDTDYLNTDYARDQSDRDERGGRERGAQFASLAPPTGGLTQTQLAALNIHQGGPGALSASGGPGEKAFPTTPQEVAAAKTEQQAQAGGGERALPGDVGPGGIPAPTYSTTPEPGRYESFAPPTTWSQPLDPSAYQAPPQATTGPAVPVDTSIDPEGFERSDQGRGAVAQSDQPAPRGGGVQPVDTTMPPGAFERGDPGRGGTPYGSPYTTNVPPGAEPQAPGPGAPRDVIVQAPSLAPPTDQSPLAPGPVGPGPTPSITAPPQPPSPPAPPYAPPPPPEGGERARPGEGERGRVTVAPPVPGPGPLLIPQVGPDGRLQFYAPPPVEGEGAERPPIGPPGTQTPGLTQRQQEEQGQEQQRQEQERRRQQQQQEQQQRELGLAPQRAPVTGPTPGLTRETAPTGAAPVAGVVPTEAPTIGAGRTTTKGEERQQIEPPATTLPPIPPARAKQLPEAPKAPAVEAPKGAPPAPPGSPAASIADIAAAQAAREAPQEAKATRAERQAARTRDVSVPPQNMIPPDANQEQIDAHKTPQRAEQRAAIRERLAADPALRDRFEKVVRAEGGDSLAKSTTVAEATINRAIEHFNGDIAKAIAPEQFEGRGTNPYFPAKSDPDRKGASSNANSKAGTDNALNGSDLIDGATGNETGRGGIKGNTARFTGNNNVAAVGRDPKSPDNERYGRETRGPWADSQPLGARTGPAGRAQAQAEGRARSFAGLVRAPALRANRADEKAGRREFSPQNLQAAERAQPLRPASDRTLDFSKSANVNVSRMNPAAVDAFNRAYRDYVAQGGDASSAHANSGYRPATQAQAEQMQNETPGIRSQEQIRRDMARSGETGPAASIGTSNHGTGNGLDLKLGGFRTWLATNGQRYGLAGIRGGLKGDDPYHVEYVGPGRGTGETQIARQAPVRGGEAPRTPSGLAENRAALAGGRGTVPAVPGTEPVVQGAPIVAPPTPPAWAPQFGPPPVQPVPGRAGTPSGPGIERGLPITGGVVSPLTPGLAGTPSGAAIERGLPIEGGVTAGPGIAGLVGGPSGLRAGERALDIVGGVQRGPGEPGARGTPSGEAVLPPGYGVGRVGEVTREPLARLGTEGQAPAGPGEWGVTAGPGIAGRPGAPSGPPEQRPAVEPTAEEMAGGYQPSVGAGGVQPGVGVPGAPGAQAGETRGGFTLTGPPTGEPTAQPGLTPIAEPTETAGVPGAPGTQAGLAPEGRPTAPPETPPTETPPTETPPTETPPTSTYVPPSIGVLPKPPTKPETKTEKQRIEEAFQHGLQRMSPEERAKIQEYRANVTDKMKSDLVNGKMTVYEFMAQGGGNKVSAATIKSIADGTAMWPLSNYRAEVLKGMQGIQQTVAEARQGIASDRQLMQAYTAAAAAVDKARDAWEREAHQSYLTAQQAQPPAPQPPAVAPPPPAQPEPGPGAWGVTPGPGVPGLVGTPSGPAAERPGQPLAPLYDPSAYEMPPFTSREPPPSTGPIEIGPERQERPGELAPLYDPSAYEKPPFTSALPPPPTGPIEIGPERPERPGEEAEPTPDYTGAPYATMQYPPMTPAAPPGRPAGPGGIREIGPDPNVDYYSVPPYAPPPAPTPPVVAPPAPPPTVSPPAPPPITAPPVPPSVTPPSVAPPAAPTVPAPAAPRVAAAPPAAPAAPYYPPSYFGGREEAIAQQVQTEMRRNPARVAALMDANPNMGVMLASIFTPDQLSEMFADVGFSRGEANPPPRRDNDQQQQQQQQQPPAPTMAQGGLVDLPGYYQQGGEMLPVPTDEQIRAAARGPRPNQPLYQSYETTWAQKSSGYPYLTDQFRVRPAEWERFLREQPQSTNVVDTRGQPPPVRRPGEPEIIRNPDGSFSYRYETGGLVPLPRQTGGLTLGGMNTLSKQAHFTGLNTRAAIPKPGVHLISSSVPGRVDRIPMRAGSGSYILPADVVSGLGQGNTMAGAAMWGKAISHSIGPMGMANAIKARSMKQPSLRMPSPNVNPRDYGGAGFGFKGQGWGKFADGGETNGDDFTPIITAGGEAVVDPEIVEALGGGDAEAGKKVLANSVRKVRSQTIAHMKKLPGPVA